MKAVGVISFLGAGGAQEAILRLARQMRERGHEMEIWGLYESNSTYRGVAHTRALLGKPASGILDYCAAFVALVRALRRERPDVVIGFLPLGNICGALAGLLTGVPLRLASQRSPGTTYGRIMRLLDRLMGELGIYHRIICVSGAVKDSFSTYSNRYRRRIEVIHNGIEWDPSALTLEEARRKFDLADDDFVFVAMGRLHSQKNYPFLLRAFARTRGSVLAIAGDGPDRATLEALSAELGVSDRVKFLGLLDRSGTRALLKAASAFVQPSLFEGQSNAVLEAMHAGLPMVLSDIPEQRETVIDPESGTEAALLVSLQDDTAWAQALERLSSDKPLRDQLGQRAELMVNQTFSLLHMVDKFERVLMGKRPV